MNEILKFSKKSLSIAVFAAALALASSLVTAEPIPLTKEAAESTTNNTDVFFLDEDLALKKEKRGLSVPFLIVSMDPAAAYKCLDDANGALPNKQPHIWDCNVNNNNQRLRYDDGTKEIKLSAKGICLEHSSTSVVFAGCNGQNSQKWRFIGPNMYNFRPYYDNTRCLEKNAGSGNSVQFKMNACSGTNNLQKFNAMRALTDFGNSFLIKHTTANLCLTHQWDYGHLFFSTCDGNNGQQYFRWNPSNNMLMSNNKNGWCPTRDNDNVVRLRPCDWWNTGNQINQRYLSVNGQSKSWSNWNCLGSSDFSSGSGNVARIRGCGDGNVVSVNFGIESNPIMSLQKRQLTLRISSRTFYFNLIFWA
jgi:hypothetical protein